MASLADLIQVEQTKRERVKCKTCLLVAQLSESDRETFRGAQIPASVLAGALNALAEQLGLYISVGEASVRVHIRDGHQ